MRFCLGFYFANVALHQMNIAAISGLLASQFIICPTDGSKKGDIEQVMGKLFLALIRTADTCSLDLSRCILAKLALNAKKYPVALCKGKAGKYTKYSNETGITKSSGQSTVEELFNMPQSLPNESNASVNEITELISKFASDRNWDMYHTERNLILALIGELGELAELFQWKGDGPDGAPIGLKNWEDEEKDTVAQELADVTIYLMRLATKSGVDIGKAAFEVGQQKQ